MRPTPRQLLCLLTLLAQLGCGGLVDFGPESLDGAAPSDSPVEPDGLLWTRQFGTIGQDKASAVAFTSGDSVLLAGWTAPGPDDDDDAALGMTDSFVRRYDHAGTLTWAVEFGTSDSDGVYAAVAKDEDAIVAGYCRGSFPGQESLGESDAFVTRVLPDGTVSWTAQFGSSSHDVAYAIATAANDELLVAGYVAAALPGRTSAGAEDAFWARFSGSGELLSLDQFGGAKQDVAFAVCAHADGGFTLAGSMSDSLDGEPHQGKEDAFVARYDAFGRRSFVRLFGGPSKDVATSVVCLDDGSIVVGGYSYGSLEGGTGLGSYDGFLRKFDAQGGVVFSRVIGSDGSDYVFGLAAHEGMLYVAGATDGLVAGDEKSGRSDSFVIALDEAGNEHQSWQFGSPEFGEARAIAVSPKGRLAAAGYSQGPLPGQIGQGAVDAYVTLLD